MSAAPRSFASTESPLQNPYSRGQRLLDATRALNRGAWLAVIEGPPLVDVLDRIDVAIRWALDEFEEFRFPPLPEHPVTRIPLCMPAGQRQRLPAAVHREACRMSSDLLMPWNQTAVSGAPDRSFLEQFRIWPQPPLHDGHRASLAALICLGDAVAILAGERARLLGLFRLRAPALRFECGRKPAERVAVADALTADEACRLKNRSAC